MEAIVLAGGLGTRLSSIIKDIPKPMAQVNGQPFLEYILNQLIKYDVKRIILSVGYKYNIIYDYFGIKYKNADIVYSIEDEPLGTGGAIKKAIELSQSDRLIILNGDTYFDVNLIMMMKQHLDKRSIITMSVKYMEDFDRYGCVKINYDGIVENFIEKKKQKSGYINAGIYVINKKIFNNPLLPEKFSFEKDFLEKEVKNLDIDTFCSKGYFIDIGIPEDYYKANNELMLK